MVAVAGSFFGELTVLRLVAPDRKVLTTIVDTLLHTQTYEKSFKIVY